MQQKGDARRPGSRCASLVSAVCDGDRREGCDPDRGGEHGRRAEAPRPSRGRSRLAWFSVDGQRQRRLLAHDVPREALQVGARLQAELVGQAAAGRLVHGESVGMPARPVQRDHQLRDEPLAVRVLPDERAELGDDAGMAAELQLCVESLLERPQAKLLQAIRLRPERDIGQRRAAPEPHPLERQGGSALVLAGGGRGRAVLDERCEAPGVDGPAAEIEPVAAAATLDRRPERLQDAAEPRNVALDGVRRGWRRVVAPELVDQAVRRGRSRRRAGRGGQARSVASCRRPGASCRRPEPRSGRGGGTGWSDRLASQWQ